MLKGLFGILYSILAFGITIVTCNGMSGLKLAVAFSIVTAGTTICSCVIFGEKDLKQSFILGLGTCSSFFGCGLAFYHGEKLYNGNITALSIVLFIIGMALVVGIISLIQYKLNKDLEKIREKNNQQSK